MGGGISSAASAAEGERENFRTHVCSALDHSLRRTSNQENSVPMFYPSQMNENDSDELIIVSPNLKISIRKENTLGISNNLDEIAWRAFLIFCSCEKRGRISGIESAFIVNMCLRSHRFDGRAVLDVVSTEMSNMTLELTLEISNDSIKLDDLLTILNSICMLIEKHNTLWK